MKLLLIALLTTFLFACNSSSNSYPVAENAFDAGREFLQAFYKGDFERAGFYMKKDTENNQILDRLKKEYRRRSEHERLQFAEASINIIEIEEVEPETTVISYRNSYDKIARKLKVIRHSNQWLVDFKFTFNGNL